MNDNPAIAGTSIGVYQCPSAGRYSDFPNHRIYYGVAGGKTLAAHASRGDVFVDGMFALNFWRRMSDIADGTSHTICVGESVHVAKWGLGPGYGVADQGGPVAWPTGGACRQSDNCGPGSQSIGMVVRSTKYPINTSLLPMADDEDNEPPFGSQHPGGAQFVFADGHVSLLSETMDLDQYRALSTVAGGEVLKISEY